MPDTTVTLNDVESKDVIARGEDATVYSFFCSDGNKYTTFKRDVAIPGSQLRGRLVTIDYTSKDWQKGEKSGKNYYLNGIKLADTGAAEQPTATEYISTNAPGAGGAYTPIALTSANNIPTLQNGYTSGPSDKDTSIARAVALKAAVETATGLQLVDADQNAIIAIAEVYVGWLLTGASSPVVAASNGAGDSSLVPF